VRDETVASLKAASATLKSKAPEELEPYRAFVTKMARAVAAAKGGQSAVETAALKQIDDALAA
jgi:hypothetical protein